MPDGDSALDALRALIKVLDENEERFAYVRRRATEIAKLRDQEYTWRQILATEDHPLIIDVLSQNMALLNEVGGRFRREEARQMRDEGAKTEEIADLLGVTVPHVEAMLDDGA